MTKKDFNELQTVTAMYSMCIMLNELLYQCKYCDIPDCMKEKTESLIEALGAMINQMETYRDDVRELFLRACSDYEKEDDHD